METQLIIAADLGYLDQDNQDAVIMQLTRVAQLLNALITSLRPASAKRSTIHDSRSTNG